MSKPTDVPETENDNPEGLKLPVAVFGTETAQPSDFPVYEEVDKPPTASEHVAKQIAAANELALGMQQERNRW